jgi:hypothetical protein
MSAARARLLFLASVLLGPSVASAETVDQIVARHVAARGGRPALAAVRTLRMTGHAVAGPGRRAIVRREFARPDRIRTEFEFQGTLGVYVWSGKSGWQVSPLDGQLDVQPLSPEAAALSAEQADFEGPLVDWKAKGHSIALVGRTALPGGAADELKVTLKSGVVRHVWVDAKTSLVVKTASTRKVKGHEMTFEVTYGDYQETSGVRFARSIVVQSPGRPEQLRITVEGVEVNPALDVARFEPPR